MDDNEVIRLLFCSADPHMQELLAGALGGGYEVIAANSDEAPPSRERIPDYDVVLLDLRSEVHGAAGGEMLEPWEWLLAERRALELPPPVVVMLSIDDRVLVRKLMEKGAYDTVVYPPDIAELRLVIRRAHRFQQMERELSQWRNTENGNARLLDMIGYSEAMQRVFALIQRIAPCDVNVLVSGETGTGKELVAKAIHRLSTRAHGPFMAFSCANMPESLVEDELFGHEKGAFTGAFTVRRGRFEAADKGTLFLDEIGDLPLGLQAKLLRVLQERTFERLGSNRQLAINIRLICATHCNLHEMVEKGTFREDLYYRLNVVQIQLPPLRDRRESIAALAHHFLKRFAEQFGKPVHTISPLALQALEEYRWPGNVRELENVVQRAVVIAEGSVIETRHLPVSLRNGFEEEAFSPTDHSFLRSYEAEVRDFKRRLILRALRECGWQKRETAQRLGLARGYLYRLINQLDIETDEVAIVDAEDENAIGRVM